MAFKERTSSTMDDARELARAGCPTGTVVVAGYQEKGRGRVPGRVWISPPGQSLLATVVLRVNDLGFPLSELALRCGVAVARAVEETSGIEVEIKWPNDVMAGGKKVAGLLCEAAGDLAFVGIGVNCTQASFPPEISSAACSLLQAGGRPVSLPSLLSAILSRLKEGGSREGWRDELRGRLHRRGELVRVDLLGSGRILEGVLRDVDEQGRLLLRLSGGGETAIAQGELLTDP